jgi:hypothetical protein
VVAAACREGELGAAVRRGRVSGAGDLRLRRFGGEGARRGASARGVAQLLGSPLVAGERLVVTTRRAGAELRVRVVTGGVVRSVRVRLPNARRVTVRVTSRFLELRSARDLLRVPIKR